MAGLVAQQDADLGQGILGGDRRGDRAGGLAEGLRGIGDELRRHLLRGQDIIGMTAGDEAARHAVVGRRLGRLGHHQPAFALDRPRAQGAVAAGTREHDTDGSLTLVLCQGAEEEVDRQTQPARRRGLEQAQRAVEERHVVTGRDDVGAVGFDPHAVLDLLDLHAGVALDQLGKDALVVRRKMLHQNEGHAGLDIARNGREEGLERGQAAGGGADADDGEGLCCAPLGRRSGGIRVLARVGRDRRYGRRRRLDGLGRGAVFRCRRRDVVSFVLGARRGHGWSPPGQWGQCIQRL